MTDLPAGLFQRWVHSFEEDQGDITVYRPAGFDFPPARGRAGIELLADGTAIEQGIGRGDASTRFPGRWQLAGPGRLHLSFGGARAARFLEIVEASPSVLKVRRHDEAI